MKRILVLFAVLTCHSLPAAEGMWPPHRIPDLAGDLRARGLELDPSSMTELTGFPMDAVISLGGCTASFVSSEGLIATNHHCVRGSLQYNSTAEQNLIERGFLAAGRGEELPAAPGSRVYVTVEVHEVTGEITGKLSASMGGLERYQAIERNEKRLVKNCERDPGHRCAVYAFYGGLEYWLIKRVEIRDVRLVYAPSRSIGVFGGDVDNWMWPRHTGDFGFYRAYVGKDGRPADHDPANVPYRPAHHLKVSPGGVRENDLVLVIGYPGRTRRHALAREVENAFGWYYPKRKELLEGWLRAIEGSTAENPDAAVKYASSVSGLNNSIKNYDGLLEGSSKRDILGRRRRQEAELAAWLEARADGGVHLRSVLADLDRVFARKEAVQERELLFSLMDRGTLLGTARDLYRLARERQKPDAEREPDYQERDLRSFRQRMTRLERRYDPSVDREVWSYLLERYSELPEGTRVPALDRFLGLDRRQSAVVAKLRQMYEGTRLGDTDQRLQWMERPPRDFEDSEDPFLRLAVALYEGDMEREREQKAIDGDLLRLRPRYMEALVAFEKSRGGLVYPDANGTLRVTYGKIQGYSPRDGVFYRPFTRLQGIAEKNTGVDPFDAPPALLAAARADRYGAYALDEIDSVPVNFLSTVDTTGGNSGSPTLNGRGELVGLLFDGTHESIDADWDFDSSLNRSIHVDVRYLLWVLEQIDHAEGLLGELGLRSPTQ